MRKTDKYKPQYPIIYKGKTYNTTIRKELTDEEFKGIAKEYYTRPDFEFVKKQLVKIYEGGKKVNYITNYYFKDLMAKVHILSNNWSIEEALHYKPLMEFFAGKCARNTGFYPPTKSLCENITNAFRLCGFGTASKPTQFPIQTVDNILEKYNVNNNYYDYACGWGIRLLSSLRNNINYFGTDPNHLLCKRLWTLADDYKSANNCTGPDVDIRRTGSETFIPEWENKIGVAFSSPPYFNLEDYKVGKQSYIEGKTTYEEWINDYVKPTINNIYKYLVPHGYLCVNIKNIINYNLVQDWDNIITHSGFEFVCTEELKNRHRCHGHVEWNTDELRESKCGMTNNDEKIYIYRKR